MPPKNQPTKAKSDSSQPSAAKQTTLLQQRHLFIGWLGLLLFLSLGTALEMMHGFKLGFYLDVQNSSRRLMWTLAHTHGTLFALIHIAFACSLGLLKVESPGFLVMISKCLIGALILMPLGFFSGGLWMYGGDPGLGVLLVPVGALLLLVGVATFCITLVRDRKLTAIGTPKNQEKQPGKPARKGRKKR
jgi:hypothetical protein